MPGGTTGGRVALLRAASDDPDTRVQETAIRTLASAFPMERNAMLTQVLPWMDGARVDYAMEWLGRPPQSWELESDDAYAVATSPPEHPGCEGWSIGLEQHRPAEAPLAAPRGRRSLRCWPAPEKAGETPNARLAVGTVVTAVDVFETGAEDWYEVEIDDREEYCWIRSAALEPLQPAVSPPRRSVVVEFDARREFLDSREARLLDDVGLLEPFDVARHVTGVAVEIPLEDLAAAIRVLEVYHLSDAMLREHLRPALRALRRHHPEWDLFDGIWLGEGPDPGPAIRGRIAPPGVRAGDPQVLDANSR